MNAPKYLTFEELSAAHDRLQADYERTREVVDLLVKKFEGHVHEFETADVFGPVVTTDPPKRAEPTFEEMVEAARRDALEKFNEKALQILE